jgi:futalosine hydrolase
VAPSTILLVCSVQLEAEPVLRRLAGAAPMELRHRSAWRGCLAGRGVILLNGGMGKANAAQSVTMVLEREPVSLIVSFGVAGAYPDSGLAVGDVALAEVEHYGDEGVNAPAGWISCEGIGIPLVEVGEVRLFNDFPVDRAALGRVSAALERAGSRPSTGPFVTVSCCSGTTERGRELARRFGAICESMEGAAHAHVAALYGIPFLELRGISNRVEDRDLAGWRLVDAAEAAAGALPVLVSACDP